MLNLHQTTSGSQCEHHNVMWEQHESEELLSESIEINVDLIRLETKTKHIL